MAQATDPVLLTDRFALALERAFEFHGEQRRKGSEAPYIGHLLGVASIVIEAGGSENEAIAALLHDAAEDVAGEETLERIRADFGDDVAEIVAECSDTFERPKPPWRQRKEAYIARLETASEPTITVSLADKLQNARAILLDYRAIGEPFWVRFNAPREDVIWYYRTVAALYLRRRPGILAEELKATVDEIAELVARGGP